MTFLQLSQFLRWQRLKDIPPVLCWCDKNKQTKTNKWTNKQRNETQLKVTWARKGFIWLTLTHHSQVYHWEKLGQELKQEPRDKNWNITRKESCLFICTSHFWLAQVPFIIQPRRTACQDGTAHSRLSLSISIINQQQKRKRKKKKRKEKKRKHSTYMQMLADEPNSLQMMVPLPRWL